MPLNELESALEELKVELDKLQPASSQMESAGKSMDEAAESLLKMGGALQSLSEKNAAVAQALLEVNFPEEFKEIIGKLDSAANTAESLRADMEALKSDQAKHNSELKDSILEILEKQRKQLIKSKVRSGFIWALLLALIAALVLADNLGWLGSLGL